MLEKRIKEVMATVLGVNLSEIDENASPGTIEAWDSLKQMSLILSLEEEFNIHFTDDQTVELLNYKLIKITIEDILKGQRA